MRKFAVAVLLGSLPTLASAQVGYLSGTVRSGGAPLAGARVETLQDQLVRGQSLAGDDGRYRVSVPAGEYAVRVRLPGFGPMLRAGVRVAAGETTVLDVELVPAALALDRVVVTTGRTEQRLEDAVSTVSVVDESLIRQRLSVTPMDVVAATPGVDVAVQGLVARRVVARGFNSLLGSSMLLLTDFRNAALPSPRANLSYMLAPTLDDLERVEIVRGPVSALYGPNGADGVVHFITKSPLDDATSSVSLTAGSRDLRGVDGRWVRQVSDRFAFKVSGSYVRGTEWPAPPSPLERVARDPRTERAGGEFRADWRATRTGTAVFTAGTSSAVRVLDYTQIGVYQLKDFRSDFAQARYADGRFFAQVYWNGNAGVGTSTSLQQGLTVRDQTSNLAAQVQHGFDLGARTAIAYGLDVTRTDPQTLGTIHGRNEESDRIDEIGGYVQGTSRLGERMTLLASARVDHHSRLEAPVFSPRLGLTWSPRDGHTLRASFNRAYSTPAPLQFSADLVSATLDPLPYALRALGVPRNGFRFDRGCGGPCMRSPFAGGAAMPLDATALWPAVVAVMAGAGVDLSGLPAPTAAQVGTSLRTLDLAAGAYRAAGPLTDLDPLRPVISNTTELGYKGLIGGRLLLDLSVYATRRFDFVGGSAVVTPNVFLNTADLAVYLAGFMPAVDAGILAAGIGGVDGNPSAPGIPLATVGAVGAFAGTDIIISNQNVGDVDLWGADVSAEFVVSPRLTLTGAFSYVSENLFVGQGTGGADLATNTPKDKALLGARFSAARHGLTLEVRGRQVGAFRMVDGLLAGDVEGYTIGDLELGLDWPSWPGARLTVTVQNVGDARHAEFVAHPMLGRMVMSRLQYRFR